MQTIISPSILAANFYQLGNDIELLNNSEAQWIHIDVMDGVFVPNISFGFPILKAVSAKTNKFCDVHLMIEQPSNYFNEFKAAGADGLTIHYEGNLHLHRDVTEIKKLGMKAGVALNPHTPVSVLKEPIAELDLVLIMSVNPGFGGQSFIPNTLQKIAEAKALINQYNPNVILQVDGGVGPKNAKAVLQAGANCLVSGSAVFKADNPTEAISEMKNMVL